MEQAPHAANPGGPVPFIRRALLANATRGPRPWRRGQPRARTLAMFSADKVIRLARTQAAVQTYEIEQYRQLLATTYAA